MWRLYMDNEEDRLSLLVTGLYLRGRQVPLQNPRNRGRLQENTIRIKVKNVPLSADDGQIHRALTLQGCEIQDLFREYLRVNGELTACQTGDRVVISKVLDKTIPRNLQIGKYMSNEAQTKEQMSETTDKTSNTSIIKPTQHSNGSSKHSDTKAGSTKKCANIKCQ
ncbi:unnamed protein product [Mytilus edulis]|uniref:Uncharacterized protein n=1 Tax=Mytilus edulis TaxID=6550 RepID=A0A8S3UJI2_MYTED|nr:unnamed protein product [Mytilus edulis]